MLIYFLQHSSYCQSASATFAAVPFFVPPPVHTGRPPDWVWFRLPCFLPLADPSTLRTLSKMVKKLWRSLLWLPGTFWIAPSSSPCKAVWSLSWLTSWKRQILVKSSVNYLNWHIMSLSEFHDTLATIILHFSGDIGDGHCHGEISLIRCRVHPFSYFAFW
jgi:hypothetical protein